MFTPDRSPATVTDEGSATHAGCPTNPGVAVVGNARHSSGTSSTTGRLARCLACRALTRARVWAHRLPLCDTCVRDYLDAIIEYAHGVAELEQLIARRERRALLRAEGLETADDRFEELHANARSEPVIAGLHRLADVLGPERHRRLRCSWRKIVACRPTPKKQERPNAR